MPTRRAVERAILAAVTGRAPRTVCPSEVARRLAPDDWRPLMPLVREVAADLVDRQRVIATQRGRPVDPLAARGPLRLALGYRMGRGEEGVLTIEPYKSELLPLWRFATPALAEASAAALWERFEAYGRAGDFAGMDMARKFLQMGMTRATRYARHRGGRKYAPGTRDELPRDEDPEKAEAAAVFRAAWDRARADPTYQRLRRRYLSGGAA